MKNNSLMRIIGIFLIITGILYFISIIASLYDFGFYLNFKNSGVEMLLVPVACMLIPVIVVLPIILGIKSIKMGNIALKNNKDFKKYVLKRNYIFSLIMGIILLICGIGIYYNYENNTMKWPIFMMSVSVIFGVFFIALFIIMLYFYKRIKNEEVSGNIA